MEEKEYTAEEEKLFTKGFNEGYLLREHKPLLLDSLLKGITSGGNTPRVEGLRAGSAQREKEVTRERIRSAIGRGDNGQEKLKGRDRER